MIDLPINICNQRVGAYEDPVLSWQRFDALPAELRRVYALAPFRMHMGGARKRLAVYERAGASVANMRQAEIFFLAKHLQQRALETYGPDHPDAKRSRLEGRARRTLHSPSTAGRGRT